MSEATAVKTSKPASVNDNQLSLLGDILLGIPTRVLSAKAVTKHLMAQGKLSPSGRVTSKGYAALRNGLGLDPNASKYTVDVALSKRLSPDAPQVFVKRATAAECPCCGHTATGVDAVAEDFGWRRMRQERKDGSVSIVYRVQSHCGTCRTSAANRTRKKQAAAQLTVVEN